MSETRIPVRAPRLLDEPGALRFLFEAGELLASSLDYDGALDSIARLTVPRLADLVTIDLLGPDDSFTRALDLHTDPRKQSALRSLALFDRTGPASDPDATAHRIAAAEPLFIPAVSDAIEAGALAPPLLRAVQTLGVHSLIAAPLVTRGVVLGALTLALSERDAQYDRLHLELVVELARRAALAVDHALLFGAAEEARVAAVRSQSALQTMVTAIDHAIFEFDAEGRYLSVAPTAAPLFYRPREVLLGRTVHQIFPPDVAARFSDWIRRALSTQRSVEIEYPLTISGRTAWFAGSVSPIGSDRVAWVVRDVTTRKVAEEALAESEKRFRATFDQAAVGISHIAPNGQFVRVNQRLCDIVGYSHEELLRLTFSDITHPADRVSHVAHTERLLNGDISSFRIEKRYIRKSGSNVWVTVTGSLVRKESGHPDYFISVIEDIDERKGLEEQLIRAQKMEAVGRLAGGVAHEFNNALTTITGFAELAVRSVGVDDPIRPDLDEIARAAWRAAGVANRLMVFSSNQNSQPEVIDLGGVVAGAQRMLAQLIGEDVELVVGLHGESTSVHADRRQLEQVVVNLAVNARDAMPDGGRLTIETSIVQVDGDVGRRLGKLIPGEYVLLSVADTGEGMTPEVQGRIFDPFFTTKEAGKGTGLGLSIVYGIVQKTGGAVEVESAFGIGTTFRIYLPRVPEPQRGVVVVGAPAGPGHGTERILLVEDDAGVRALAARVLKRLGYEVTEASSAEEALRGVSEGTASVDLLITDLVMPGMSGRELAELMTALQPGMPVLFTSGYSSEQVVQAGFEREGRSFIEKPFAPDELERAVRRALGRP